MNPTSKSILAGAACLALVGTGVAAWLLNAAHPVVRGTLADAPAARTGAGASSRSERGGRAHGGATPAADERRALERAAVLEPGVLAIRVVDMETESSIPGARVEIHEGRFHPDGRAPTTDPSSDTLLVQAITDAEGRARVGTPAALPLKLFVDSSDEDAGFGWLDVKALAAGEERDVLVSLRSGRNLVYWGQVVAERDGLPVPGAEVILYRGGAQNSVTPGMPPKRPYEELLTDFAGRFEARGYTWQGGYASIRAEGFGPALVPLVQGHSRPEEAQILKLKASATLAARVLDEHRRPAVGARVRVSTRAQSITLPEGAHLMGHDQVWGAEVEPSGSCLLEHLPAEAPLQVEILHRGRGFHPERAALTFAAGARHEYEWHLGREVLLEGVALDADMRPAAGQELWLVHASVWGRPADRPGVFAPTDSRKVTARAVTDEEGRFRFAGLAAGAWWIGPSPNGPAAYCPLPERIEVPAGVSRHEARLRLSAGRTIRGIVLNALGDPVPGHTVHARPEDEAALFSAFTDDEGRFELARLAPGAYYLLARGGASDWTAARAGDGAVVLRLDEGATLEGVVLDAETGLGVSARVIARSRPGGAAGDLPGSTVEGWSGPNGLFGLLELPAGSYDLCAVTREGKFATQRIDLLRGARFDGLVLSVEPGARLLLRNTSDSPLSSVRVLQRESVVATRNLDAGSSHVLTVPEGELSLQLWVAGEVASTRSLVTAAGEELAVSLP